MSRSHHDPSEFPAEQASPEDLAHVAAIIAGGEDDQLSDSLAGAPESAAVTEARRRRRTILLARKVAVTALGIAVMAVGAVMMVAPGPGVLVLVAGLFILSLEYEWAERRFEQLRDKALDAARSAAASKLQTNVAVLSSVGLIVGSIAWGLNEDWPYSSWTLAGSVIGSGLLALGTVIWSVIDLRAHRARTAE